MCSFEFSFVDFFKNICRMRLFLFFLIIVVVHPAFAQRTLISHNGVWEIEDSILPDDIPENYTHTVPVPGLANQASPSFKDVNKFDEYEKNIAAKTTKSPHPTIHDTVLNEYGWIWLNRRGSQRILLKRVCDYSAPETTINDRIKLAVYLLGIETEYFRVHRNYASVLHFTFLTGIFENVITGDLFKDIDSLSIHPACESYFSEIFKPLEAYINYSKQASPVSEELTFRMMMVNDEYIESLGA